jgi:hypothetical protein
MHGKDALEYINASTLIVIRQERQQQVFDQRLVRDPLSRLLLLLSHVST